ncbi:type I-E CRISPR-associated protein Cse2/CasB [Leucobacter sp. HNU]|uniref:type I-E CRISPR-associated protein Cse2/CasB n=1 Tax=Leucobacter sp. HNU TaxID=3236805 RepID=UPI003A7FE255
MSAQQGSEVTETPVEPPAGDSAANGGPGAEGGRRPRNGLGHAVAAQAFRLQRGYLADEAWAVRALAQLRRGIGKGPGEIIELLQWTSPGVFVPGYRSDAVSEEERAAHLALTLYALHQQGHRERGMHLEGRSFGEAARKLRIDLGERSEAGVLRRFNAVGTATDQTELVRHARGLIQQFRAEKIALDYGLFAEDLRKLSDPRSAALVRLRWGRHFHRPGRAQKPDPAPEAAPAPAAE